MSEPPLPGELGKHSILIRPGMFGMLRTLHETWACRELLYFLAWRDIHVRYKQAIMGFAWALLQPLLTMVVFTLVFNRIAGIDSGNIAYPVFSFTGVLPWQLFQNSMQRCSESVVNEARVLTKVYFPRFIIPFASVISALADFCVALVILFGLIIYYDITPTWRFAVLPLFIAYAVFAALAVGLWLSALNARFRDVRHIVPFMLRLWMFLSPVAYPLSTFIKKFPPAFHWVYTINPMVGVIEGFRWALLGTDSLEPALFVNSVIITVLLFIGGVVYFRRVERTFADVL
ncbi:MAG: ABC transporter permease [Planctomycetes bacterium]|nr:ABC transporter permease [Planctomycetota bacterium]